MIRAGQSLDLWRAWTNSLVRAFALSLAFHFILFSGIEIGRSMGLWHTTAVPEWLSQAVLESMLKSTAEQQKNKAKDQPDLTAMHETPLLFVEVDPVQTTVAPPKEAKFYSSRNSTAANPDPLKETEMPKIDGKQTKVTKTLDVSKLQPAPTPKPEPPKPAPETPKPLEPTVAEAKPEVKPRPAIAREEVTPGPKPGDMDIATAQTKPAGAPPSAQSAAPATPTIENPQPRTRPRTIAAALAQNGILVGEKSKQDGGVKRRATMSLLDVKATPFGAYDAAIIAAIQQRWFDLLDQNDYTRGHTGKVVLDFRLMEDGRITVMQVSDNDVGELLGIVCQRAVLDPAPYAPWPSDMRRMLHANYRDVRFTFYYE
jgi:hypothetical protein